MARRGLLDMACWVLICHGAYLRPSVSMQLRKRCLIEPMPGVSEYWCLLLSSSEYGLVNKQGTSDDSVVWDPVDLLWMGPLFKLLKAGPPDEKVWNFNYPELVKEVKTTTDSLGLEFTPYMLRHSGPCWDRAKNYRTLQEVQKRGMWRSMKSIMRYEQAGRSLSEFDKLPPVLRLFLQQRATDLERHMVLNLAVPRVPVS